MKSKILLIILIIISLIQAYFVNTLSSWTIEWSKIVELQEAQLESLMEEYNPKVEELNSKIEARNEEVKSAYWLGVFHTCQHALVTEGGVNRTKARSLCIIYTEKKKLLLPKPFTNRAELPLLPTLIKEKEIY